MALTAERNEQDHVKKPALKLNVFVNQVKYEVAENVLTVRQLLDLAGESAGQVNLALKEQGKLHSYTNLDEAIVLKNGMHFIATYIGPTPVS